jgi:hypothetical protein
LEKIDKLPLSPYRTMRQVNNEKAFDFTNTLGYDVKIKNE